MFTYCCWRWKNTIKRHRGMSKIGKKENDREKKWMAAHSVLLFTYSICGWAWIKQGSRLVVTWHIQWVFSQGRVVGNRTCVRLFNKGNINHIYIQPFFFCIFQILAEWMVSPLFGAAAVQLRMIGGGVSFTMKQDGEKTRGRGAARQGAWTMRAGGGVYKTVYCLLMAIT